jgi:hypothetical protein
MGQARFGCHNSKSARNAHATLKFRVRKNDDDYGRKKIRADYTSLSSFPDTESGRALDA